MTKELPIIYLCVDCGEEIKAATKYQIRQDRCYHCFRKLYLENKSQSLLKDLISILKCQKNQSHLF